MHHAVAVGHRVIAGRLRESRLAVVLNMTRSAVIVFLAAFMSIGSTSRHDLVASQLPTAVTPLFTGSNESTPDSINKNLVSPVAAINVVRAPSNDTATAIRNATLLISDSTGEAIAIGTTPLFHNA